jgi:hypothetical protein
MLPRLRAIQNKPTKRKSFIVLYRPLNFKLLFFAHISTT